MNSKIQNLSEALSEVLGDLARHEFSADGMAMACVALLLRAREAQDSGTLHLEVGFIQRVQRAGDPWSGQIAFAGGKADQGDKDDLATVMREALEEIGFDLLNETLLGKLSDQQVRSSLRIIPLFLRPFVFFLQNTPTVILQVDEVADFFWVSIADLIDLSRVSTHPVQLSEARVELPAVDVGRGVPLWGLTYKIVTEFIFVIQKLERSHPQVWKDLALNSEHLRKWRTPPNG